MPNTKRYLGDGLYAQVKNGQLVLSAENGLVATNVVYLEDKVVLALMRVVGELYDDDSIDTEIDYGRDIERVRNPGSSIQSVRFEEPKRMHIAAEGTLDDGKTCPVAFISVDSYDIELDGAVMTATFQLAGEPPKNGGFIALDLLPDDFDAEMIFESGFREPCKRPPKGWVCSMEVGHDGECVEDIDHDGL